MGMTGSWVTDPSDSAVISCTDRLISLGTPMLLPVHDPTRNIVAMSQVPKNFPPLSISADILKGKTGRCLSVQDNLQAAQEDSESEIYFGAESEQVSDEGESILQKRDYPQMMRRKRASCIAQSFKGWALRQC